MALSTSRPTTRNIIMLAMSAGVIFLLLWAFWPRALMVDLGTVETGPMTITIDEEARTQVRDAYVVSAPVAGRLLRVEVEPGDTVIQGETVIASMTPSPPSALDVRTGEQARAAINAAEAALRVARADLTSARAVQDLADADLLRMRTLIETDVVSQVAVDHAERQKRIADASVDTARAAISMRSAELDNARARLISYTSTTNSSDTNAHLGATKADNSIPLLAPISGRILRVIQESETTLSPGQTILEIGDVSNDLEIISELLSADAVKVKVGDPVMIDNWGGDIPLNGIVERVEPWGFTKYSALGVEEQRVNTIIRFTDSSDVRNTLGHGYRVEVRIVIWESKDALIIPSSAIFRANDGWSTFVASGRKAKQVPVEIGRNNGIQAEVISGVSAGTAVVLYPAPGLSDGQTIKSRD